MYTIFKNNKRTTKKLFTSFETARQYLRKRLRKLTTERVNGQPATGVLPWTPLSYTQLGYSIRKI